MLKVTGEKSKAKQYIIGGIVALIIICAWISGPFMQGSSMDASVATGNFFKTRTADVSSLGNDIPQEGGAPGYALSGEMLNNPATSGENIASSLFQSGPSDEAAEGTASASDSGKASVPLPGAPASGGAAGSSASGSKGKLNYMPSITSGNSNSMTAGGAYNKFFGSGAGKSELAPASDQNLKNMTASDKRNSLVAMLTKTEAKSAQAAKSANPGAAASGATSAFGKTANVDNADLNTDLEQDAAESGLALGAAAQDLKTNDPQLSKKKVTLPVPKAVKDDSADEEIKKMLIQMIISSLLGPMFSSMFSAGAGEMGATGATGTTSTMAQ
ncbi:MAG: hypothetical protein WCK75_06285 [Elusimicrobiota bacterium]